MSTTRSRFPKAPAIDASATGVLLVGHGSATRPEAERGLANHGRALAALGRFAAVSHGMLNGARTPEDALAQMGEMEEVFVVPVFMCDGYPVRHLLPDRLAAVDGAPPLRFCPAVGLCPEIAQLAGLIAEEAVSEAGWHAEKTDLILTAHGSMKGDASRQATRTLAARLSALVSFRAIRVAYLEERPHVADVVCGPRAPAVVLGLFAGDGVHAAVDVPKALKEVRRTVIYSGAIGSDRRVPDILLSILERERLLSAAA